MTVLFLPEGFEDDLERILNLNDEQIRKLAEVLDGEGSTQSAYRLAKTYAAQAGLAPYEAYVLVQLARYLDEQKKDTGKSEAEMVAELAIAYPDRADAIKARAGVLQTLLGKKDRAAFYRKKRNLSRGPVKTLKSISGVCDVRPVFDASRERIVDHFPVIIARILVEDDMGDQDTHVLQIEESGVTKLDEFLEVTKRKLGAMAKAIEVTHADG